MRCGRLVCLGLATVLVATGVGAGEALTACTLTVAGGKALAVKQTAAAAWTVTEGEASHTLVAENGEFTFRAGETALAAGKLKGSKLKLAKPDGTLYLVVDFKVDKAKFGTTEEGDGWEIKRKADSAKLRKGETETAKCKFYPDTGKLKVKDAKDAELIVSRDLKRFSAAPLALLAPGLDAGQRKCLLLVLFIQKR